MTRPIRARIDLSALEHNLAVARRHAGPARVLAVAKAAAYGHGLARALPALAAADGIAVLDLDDAVAIRDRGYEGRIVLLEGCFDSAALPAIAAARLDVVVHTDEQVRMLEAAPSAQRVGVLLKFNSGMNRLGFRAGPFRQALARLRGTGSVAGITLMTHFACADEPDGVVDALAAFEAACGDAPEKRSCANSAALFRHPATRGQWVRPGIALYGASPFADRTAAACDLRPVMTLESRLIAVQTLAAGERVGYGGRFTAPRAMRVGVVACGYADGYPRHAPDGTPILVEGVRTGTVGRISMDMLVADLTPVPGAGIGSAVTLWGEGLPVDDVAVPSGTVGYELLCALAPRVPVSVSSGAVA